VYAERALWRRQRLKLRREITEAITNFIIVTFWASESALTIVRAAGKKLNFLLSD
jgi:hypothetical protein